MGLIMKNGIAYGGGSGSSGGGTAADTTHIELTFAEYQELEKQGKVDSSATYFITDDNMNGVNYANAVLYDDTETNIGVNNVQDAIMHLTKNGGNSGDNCSETIELTQAEYDALGETVNSDNKTYYITDSEEELDASMIAFDDSETELGVHNVQDAINEQNKKIDELLSEPVLLGHGGIVNDSGTSVTFTVSDMSEYKALAFCMTSKYEGVDSEGILLSKYNYTEALYSFFKKLKSINLIAIGNTFTVGIYYVDDTTIKCTFSDKYNRGIAVYGVK